jgi:hypothetical protein
MSSATIQRGDFGWANIMRGGVLRDDGVDQLLIVRQRREFGDGLACDAVGFNRAPDDCTKPNDYQGN